MKKVLISILSALAGAAFGAGAVGKVSGESLDKVKGMSDKHLALFLMMNQWVKVKQKGKNLEEYFKQRGYQKIAVYGMSYAGKTLLEELMYSDVTVSYAIDKKADLLYADIDILSVDDKLREVDAIVVTAITFYDEIKQQLLEKVKCPIISLEDILYEVQG